jgi:hypothetical protein
MTIAAVASQAGKGLGDNATSMTKAFTNPVSTNSLIVIGAVKYPGTSDVFLAADCTKSAGTATIGAITLDKQFQISNGASSFIALGIWSCVVTAGGTLTLQIAGMPSGSYGAVFTDEYTGSFDSSRVDGTPAQGGSYTASQTAASSGNVTTAGAGLIFGVLGVDTSSNPFAMTEDGAFTSVADETNGSAHMVGEAIRRVVTTGTTDAADWTIASSNAGWAAIAVAYKEVAGSAATLSSATPSGTLASTTSATLGATTDSATGTFYGVVDVAANITGITATQVKAAQNNAGGAPVASGNSTVSTTSPSVGVSGLTANTLYSYAVVQNNGSDSNVLTGTFTTAAITLPDVGKYGPQGALRTLLTM